MIEFHILTFNVYSEIWCTELHLGYRTTIPPSPSQTMGSFWQADTVTKLQIYTVGYTRAANW